MKNFFATKFKAFGQAVRKMMGFGFDLIGSWAVGKGQKLLGRVKLDKGYWLKAYDESLIVKVPIEKIAQDFARIPWILRRVQYRRVGPPVYTQIYRHPFLRFMKRPSEDKTGVAFREMMIVHWLTCGEVILYIEERNALDEPKSGFLVEPHKLYETPMDNNDNVYRFIVDQGTTRQEILTVPARDVMYFNNPSAFACHQRGIGKVVALSREVQLDEKSSDWSISLYDNGSVVGTIVHMPDVAPEDLEELQDEWDQQYTGISNIGKTLFLSSDSIDGKSPMSVERLGHSHKEMDWTESKKDLMKRALLLFGIPPQVVGQIEGGSRSDTTGADYIHQRGNILPLLVRFTEEFELRLLPQFKGTRNMEIHFENPVKQDEAFVHKRLSEGVKLGTVNKDEWRAGKIELDPMEGELGQSYSLPLNMHHVDSNGNTFLEADTQAEEPREEDDADNAASSVALNHADLALEILKGCANVH